MMREQHLLSEGPLLDSNGDLIESGYAFSLVKAYERKAIQASPLRIKEWDYYYLGNKERGIALTIDDNGYMDLCSATVFDFTKATYVQSTLMRPLSLGKRQLPSRSDVGDVFYSSKGVSMSFCHENGKRHLSCVWPDFGKKGQLLRVDVSLEETTDGKSMVIATPFAKKRHFYYNQKTNNLRSSGYAKLGDDFIDLNRDTYGVLDWGRGVWTYQNTWYWSSCSAVDKGHTIGWNFGYGFGDLSSASENMVFFDKEAYKMDDVRFIIPSDEGGRDAFLKPWVIQSQSKDINLTFTPILDRVGGGNMLLIKSDQHQLFGRFNGLISVNGGEKVIEIIDLPGFAEKVFNRW